MRAIDAEKLKEVLERNFGHTGGASVLAQLIDSQPTIQPKRGRWESISYKRARICSCCGHDEPYKFADDDAPIYNFCPYCGADMRGEQNE